MTRKHLEALAEALRGERPDACLLPTVAERQWEADVRAIANACQQSNPAFDRGRFIEACGFYGEEGA